MMKRHGALGAYSPALAAPGTKTHVMKQASPAADIFESEGGRRTIFYTRQAPVAFFIYDKIGHIAPIS
jgi:hypothetical protein